MDLQKKTRLRSKKNTDHIKSLPCEVCNKPAPSECHHWKTLGAGGDDSLENLHPLCREHHHEFHLKGRETFSAAYSGTIHAFRLLHDLTGVDNGLAKIH